LALLQRELADARARTNYLRQMKGTTDTEFFYVLLLVPDGGRQR